MNPSADFAVWRSHFIDEIGRTLRDDEVTMPLFTDNDFTTIKEGKYFTDTFFEWYSLSVLLERSVHVLIMGYGDIITNRLIFGAENEDIVAFYVQPDLPTKVYIADNYDPDLFTVVEIIDDEPGEREGNIDEEDEPDEREQYIDDEPDEPDEREQALIDRVLAKQQELNKFEEEDREREQENWNQRNNSFDDDLAEHQRDYFNGNGHQGVEFLDEYADMDQ